MAASPGHLPVVQCLACRGSLTGTDGWWRCALGHSYASLAGIIDCRPELRGFDVAADRRLAEDIVGRPGATFEDLLRSYWAANGPRSPDLVDRFVTGDLIGARRAEQVVDQIEHALGSPLHRDDVALEIGCGTAALGSQLTRRCRWVVATDVSLAWLALARHRLRDAGMANVTLIAATADTLPFAANTFNLVAAADVIEHVPDPGRMVLDAYRVLKEDGTLWLSTPNRFSLTPEPHVRVWGVGWLPRPLGVRLVRQLRGVDYQDIKTLSSRGLRRVLCASGGTVSVQPPPIPAALRATYSPGARLLIDGYGLGLHLRTTRTILRNVGPLFHGTLRKLPGGE